MINHRLCCSLALGFAFLLGCLQAEAGGVITDLSPPAAAGHPAPQVAPSIDQSYGKLPLYFIENRGQVSGPVAFYVQGRQTSVYFTPKGLTFALTSPARQSSSPRPGILKASLNSGSAPGDTEGVAQAQRWTVALDFVGANRKAKPVGEDKTEAIVSYFKGPREQWKPGLPTYRSVVYRDLWPGIDLTYEGTVSRMKYTFTVRSGADPSRIRLRYRGASSVRIDPDGAVDVTTPVGGFRDERPMAYQEMDGVRQEITADYALRKVGGDFVTAFKVGRYDRSRPLVIDPVVLLYCGYIAGGGDEIGRAIAVDGAGNTYVTGETSSTDATFPVTVGPDLTYSGGSNDAFIAKVKADGTGLVYAGYIGGDNDDFGFDVAVDASGNAYVTGATFSTAATFPVTVGPDLTYNGGVRDAFVAKVMADGTGLVYAGYIGGSGDELGYGIAVDAAGNASVTGPTSSTDATFPVTVGPDLTYNGGVRDAFVAKVMADGTGLAYAGYIGGGDRDNGYRIAVDAAGNAYVTGGTSSTEVTFPVTVGPDLTYNGGSADAFVAKVKADGTALVYAGYIGGALLDEGVAGAVNAAGNAYVTGYTFSTEATFPVTVGPDLTFNGGVRDAFVAKVMADGTGLVYAGYIGGAGDESGHGIAVDAAGNAHVTGVTSSTEVTFPVTAGPDLTFNGGSADAFVAKVKADGTALVYAGYIGGAVDDSARPVAIDAAGNAYITGETYSTEATFPVTVGPDLTFNGGTYDAFVAKVGVPPPAVSVAKVRTVAGPLNPAEWRVGDPLAFHYQVSVTNTGGPSLVSIDLTDVLPVDGTGAALFDPAATCPIVVTATPPQAGLTVDNTDCMAATNPSIRITGFDALDPGASVILEYDVLILPNLPTGTAVCNEASVDATDGIIPVNSATEVCTSILRPVLATSSKSVSPNPVVAGQVVTWTLTVENTGGDAANSVSLSDDFTGATCLDLMSGAIGLCQRCIGATCGPCDVADLVTLDTSPASPTYGRAAGTFAPIAPGERVVVPFVFTTVAAAPGACCNQAHLTWSDPAFSPQTLGPVCTNVLARCAVAVAKARSVVGPGDPAEWRVGDPLVFHYQVTVTNTGGPSLVSIDLTDLLPVDGTAAALFDSAATCPIVVMATPPQAGLAVDNTNCAAATSPSIRITGFDALDPGAMVTLDYDVVILPALPNGTSVCNQASVDATDGNTVVNDLAETCAIILRPVLATSSKAVSPNPVVAGDIVTWTLTVENTGGDSANGVAVFDDFALATCLDLSKGTIGACQRCVGATCDPCGAGDIVTFDTDPVSPTYGQATCTFAPIAPGERVIQSFDFPTLSTAVGTCCNQAELTWSDTAFSPMTLGPACTEVQVSCVVGSAPIKVLLAVKQAATLDNIDMSWQADALANGYNLWYVTLKEDIPFANQAHQPPAIPVTGCAVPSPAPGTTCTDLGAVSRGAPTTFFYQARVYCDAATEGP